MTKRGTASVTGNYIEFQAAVLRTLPRDIDSDVALDWVNNGECLARVLHEALVSKGKPQPVGDTYPVVVNYEMSVEDAVKLGRYDWANDNITSRNFQTKRTGTIDLVVELTHFDKVISTDKALRELDKMGMRPAEIHELLAFSEKHPDIQRELLIIALGSVWQGSDGHRYVPYLNGNGSKRDLSLHWVESDWGEFCRFAAVRK